VPYWNGPRGIFGAYLFQKKAVTEVLLVPYYYSTTISARSPCCRWCISSQ